MFGQWYVVIRLLLFRLCSWQPRLPVRSASGQGLVEYSLILVLISIVALVILQTLGMHVAQIFGRIGGCLSRSASCW